MQKEVVERLEQKWNTKVTVTEQCSKENLEIVHTNKFRKCGTVVPPF